MRKVRGIVVFFPSVEEMEKVINEAGVTPEEPEEVKFEGKENE